MEHERETAGDTVSGTIWGVFGHRFAIEGADGKVLIDLGPKGMEGITLREGDRVSVTGERKPSEIKALHITLPDGSRRTIDRPPPKGEHAPADAGSALAAARSAGYEILGEPRRKPKHFEIAARKDGAAVELHLELDGRIRKVKAAA